VFEILSRSAEYKASKRRLAQRRERGKRGRTSGSGTREGEFEKKGGAQGETTVEEDLAARDTLDGEGQRSMDFSKK